MSRIPTPFRVFVLLAVTLTGGGFGAIAGSVYSAVFWWVGMMAGGLSAFFLARLYLHTLSKMSSDLNGLAAWFSGTLVAVGCGVVCTVAAHGAMLLVHLLLPVENRINVEAAVAILLIGVVIGAIAGLVVGGICTLAYVVLRRNWREEHTPSKLTCTGPGEDSREEQAR